jgi:peptidoglycan/xylan/chitin deacetylase (PgdA/CDA1 family)
MVRRLAVLLVAALAVASSSACEPTGPAVEVRRGPTDRRIIALTFDAGSDRGYTVAILDTLKAKRVHAAFGITGTWARANPSLIKRMVAEGHILVNHTDDHRSFTGYSTGTRPLTRSQRTAELAGAEAAVTAAGGPRMAPWFRPPTGTWTPGCSETSAPPATGGP